MLSILNYNYVSDDRQGNPMKVKTVWLMGWLIWFFAALFYALDYFHHTAPSILLVPISQAMHVDTQEVIAIMAIYFPVYAISQIPAGLLIDRYGCRWTLSLSCLIMSVGLLLFVYDSSLTMMWIGRIIVAIGSSFAFLGALKVAAEILPEKYFALAVGMTNTIGVLGGIFGQLVLAYLVTFLNWNGALWLIGIIGVGFSFVLFAALNYPKAFEPKKSTKPAIFSHRHLVLFKSWRLWLVALYAGIMVGTVVNAFSELYDVVFLEYSYHLTAVQAASISSMIFIGIAVGGPSHGIIANLINNRRLWMVIANIATIVVFASIVLLPHWFSVSFLYVIYFLLGFFVSSMLLSFAVVESQFESNVQGTALAIVNMTIGLSAAVFQYLVGMVATVVNGGDISTINHPHTFSISFLVLLIPLLLSTSILLFLKMDKLKAA